MQVLAPRCRQGHSPFLCQKPTLILQSKCIGLGLSFPEHRPFLHPLALTLPLGPQPGSHLVAVASWCLFLQDLRLVSMIPLNPQGQRAGGLSCAPVPSFLRPRRPALPVLRSPFPSGLFSSFLPTSFPWTPPVPPPLHSYYHGEKQSQIPVFRRKVFQGSGSQICSLTGTPFVGTAAYSYVSQVPLGFGGPCSVQAGSAWGRWGLGHSAWSTARVGKARGGRGRRANSDPGALLSFLLPTDSSTGEDGRGPSAPLRRGSAGAHPPAAAWPAFRWVSPVSPSSLGPAG